MSKTHNLSIYKNNELVRGNIDEVEEGCDDGKEKVDSIIF